MDNLLRLLHNYSRMLELEENIPIWQGRKMELETRIEELGWNRHQKELALEGMKHSNFFRNLLERVGDRKEKTVRQIREIESAVAAAKWELQAIEKQIEAGRRELEMLTGSREAYQRAKAKTVRSGAQESRLMMEEISSLASLAMETANHVLEALADLRPWIQEDALRVMGEQNSRKMACLNNAESAARRLGDMLAMMPEGVANIGGFLQNPDHYIGGLLSKDDQLERLNSAEEQVCTVRNQLHQLLGG